MEVQLEADDEQQERNADVGEQFDLLVALNETQAEGPTRMPARRNMISRGWRSFWPATPSSVARPGWRRFRGMGLRGPWSRFLLNRFT
jgi:hypothetical protein